MLKEVFNYAVTKKIHYPKDILPTLSQVCAVYAGIVLGTTIKLAIELNILILFAGFTPCQLR